jgi:hypothetical protein
MVARAEDFTVSGREADGKPLLLGFCALFGIINARFIVVNDLVIV